MFNPTGYHEGRKPSLNHLTSLNLQLLFVEFFKIYIYIYFYHYFVSNFSLQVNLQDRGFSALQCLCYIASCILLIQKREIKCRGGNGSL